MANAHNSHTSSHCMSWRMTAISLLCLHYLCLLAFCQLDQPIGEKREKNQYRRRGERETRE